MQTDDEGNYMIPGCPIGQRMRVSAVYVANPNVTLKALTDVPVENTGKDTIQNISSKTTAITAIVDDSQKTGSAIANIQLYKFEVTPDLIGLVERVENKIIDALSVSEVGDRYNNNTNIRDGLVFELKFEEPSGSVVYDTH